MFAVFFFVKYETRRKMLDSQYAGKTTATEKTDRSRFNVRMVRGGGPVPVRGSPTVEYHARRSTFKEVLLRQEHHPPPSTGASRCY